MEDPSRTNPELIKEVSVLKQRIQELEQLESERKRAEEALWESEEKFRTIFNRAGDGILITDPVTKKFLQGNTTICSMLGYTKEEIESLTIYDIHPPKDISRVLDEFEKQARGEKVLAEDLPVLRKDGSIFYADIGSAPATIGGIRCVVGIFRDITERKKAEEALRESEERYRYIVETSLEGIWIINEELRSTFVNQRMADMLGYAPEEIIGRTPASFMFEKDLEDYMLKVDACQRGVAEIFERRFRRKDGTTIWNIASSSPLFDSEDRFTGYFSMFTDITERKKAEEQLQQTLASLRKAVSATVQVMVSAVESRDPYTAGHQTRSADLARAIATDMGLPQEKIDAIRMTGSIHDIGKLSVPAEILAKPTKLSEIEFSLIKEHARKGYEILKDVESSWPLAEITYQHHERMDGSGYPRNLKGDDILIEARILAVADVVESMASHRPYPSGFGHRRRPGGA